MSLLKDRHRQAMDLAEEAFLAKRSGETQRSEELTRRAFELEREAAGLAAVALSAEPARSVLHRSAASLAMDCGEFREAERLIAVALAGNPPTEIAEELRELLEIIYLDHHIDLNRARPYVPLADRSRV